MGGQAAPTTYAKAEDVPIFEMPDQFKLSDDDGKNQEWVDYLEQHGAVVVRGVISPEEVLEARSKFWDYLEKMGEGMSRTSQTTCTWGNGWKIHDCGIDWNSNHTDAAWFLRTRPAVKEVFSKVWKTNDLITSFDSFITWRQWWLAPKDSEFKPYTEGLHCDQHPKFKPGKQCVQGMIPLYDVVPQIGGLEIIPGTANDEGQQHLMKHVPNIRHQKGDFVVLSSKDPLQGKGKLVLAKAGDLILWDSRAIHGGIVGPGYTKDTCPLSEGDLARLSFTICMTPKSFAKQGILEQRHNAFKKGISLNHWAHEYHASGFNDKDFKPPVEESDFVKGLIGV
mmetsp:Transcript_1355/g.1771  ORF Transcript_1355/g.1771 Transcript_1355/m.1771 type:complete len:337 (-) Transcript_1355:39-1049(-)